MKNRYCKKCGNELNPKTRLCNNCGKQYFKFRGVHVINLVVIVIMIVMGYGLYDLNSQCNILQNRCDSLQETNNELSDSLKKSQTTSKAPTTKNWREEAKKSLERRGYYDKSSEQNDSDSYQEKTGGNIDFTSEQNRSYNYQEEVTCTIPNCDRSPENNSFFCHFHECSKVGCHNIRANDYCRYCESHKCIVPDCNFGQAYNSIYCHIHKN